MAGFTRKDWEDFEVTKEEVENLTQALKKEEFRKLLAEYAEEITDPKNRQIYQDEIVQLEAERGIDCTFVNPEPCFVVKTSVDGKKKAFINICKNKAVNRPSSKPEIKDNSRGLNWSIPFCQAPGRDDLDKKKNRCVVYDVIFHPDTLHLAEKNAQFKKLVIDTALNAVEDSYNVKLDKKNIKIPKLSFKGIPFATVIRKKSAKQPVLTEEEIEFQNTIKCPFKPPLGDNDPIIKNFDKKKEDPGKYTIPKYVIKHRSDVDLQEFTYDKHAKMNAAIPKNLVIEVNLPLLNSTNTVSLDIMEKSLHLVCEKPAKYKLDIQLPYSVNEETGNAKFDKDRRLLIVTLPVIKAKMSFRDLLKEDSGVESDSSPIGSMSNNEFENMEENNIEEDLQDSYPLIKEGEGVHQEEFKLSAEESEDEKGHRTKNEANEFLDSDKHYILPGFSCNVDDNNICFVLNVKNVDSSSIVKKTLNSHACHIKFVSIGSGFFPVHYAFLIDFKNECNIENVTCDTLDNNVTVLIELVKNGQEITKYYTGLDENSLTENTLNHPLELKKMMEEISDDNDEEENHFDVEVESANVNKVVICAIPEESENSDDLAEKDDEVDSLISNTSGKGVAIADEKCRTLSESSVDEIVVSSPLARKSILKKRIYRSLSESNADDYAFSSSVDKGVSDESDLCVHEENEEIPCIKKTVRFSEKIRQQLFRVNSSILGRRKKNKKKSRNKRRALERRLSESENSEPEDKQEGDKKTKKPNKSKNNDNSNNSNNALIEVISNKEDEDSKAVSVEEDKNLTEGEEKPRLGLKKDDMIFEFKSDLIFDLDM